jgi:Amt family ammonium transporter
MTRMSLLATLFLSSGVAAMAQDDARIAELEKAVANAQMAGDNGWMLVCSALVLMMTGPGLALFYGGLVQRKNVLGTMMHSFILMAVATVLWALVGFSLAFGGSGPVIGNLDHLFLNGVTTEVDGGLPKLTFMVFQLMFAIITPALISGAFAERMKFSAMLIFTVLWSLFVYYPMAHMVWGSGGMLNAFTGGAVPCFDFAGGTVVHISSGVSALICALYIGKRKGYPTESMKPHNLVISVIGACLLWVGWFGFNAGSALNAGGGATGAFVATHFAAAAATLGWVLVEWLRDGKPSMLGAITGAVAGLVGITPGAGFVAPMPALVIGFLTGIFCYFMVAIAKQKFGYDDSLDAFGVHGVGGTLGAILTGVFATNVVADPPDGWTGLGLIDGNAFQVVNQTLGVLLTWVLAIIATLIILKICDVLVGVRVEHDDEVQGLDLSMHGEEGYNFES